MVDFPRMAWITQRFSRPIIASLSERVYDEFPISKTQLHGKRVAIAVGSRGIAHLAKIVAAAVKVLRDSGASPFIIPAMGSHGGGDPRAQEAILAEYGVHERGVGAPVVSSIETTRLGEAEGGIPVYIDRHAHDADGVVLLNRVKPHTDFSGEVESGLLKMIAIGLGKVDGARAFHALTSEFPCDEIIQRMAGVVLASGKILAGLAIIENAYHEIAELEWLSPQDMPTREPELLLRAKALMPSLPVERADILIVDRIGKNISGVGLDPNITGRRYRLQERWQEHPSITRILLREATPETGGNIVGVGLADFCRQSLIDGMNRDATYLNALTSRNTVCGMIPLTYENDQAMIIAALQSLGEPASHAPRILRIQDTLSLTRLEASEALLDELRRHPNVADVNEPRDWRFDEAGNLTSFRNEE